MWATLQFELNVSFMPNVLQYACALESATCQTERQSNMNHKSDLTDIYLPYTDTHVIVINLRHIKLNYNSLAYQPVTCFCVIFDVHFSCKN